MSAPRRWRLGCRLFNQLVERAGLMCLVSVFNQPSSRFDVDPELIKQHLQLLHQPQHFVPPLVASPRQTAALQFSSIPVAPYLFPSNLCEDGNFIHVNSEPEVARLQLKGTVCLKYTGLLHLASENVQMTEICC